MRTVRRRRFDLTEVSDSNANFGFWRWLERVPNIWKSVVVVVAPDPDPKREMIGASWRKVFAIGGLIEASSQVIMIEFLRLFNPDSDSEKTGETGISMFFARCSELKSQECPIPYTYPLFLPSNRTGRILQLHPRASRRIGAAEIASHGTLLKTTNTRWVCCHANTRRFRGHWNHWWKMLFATNDVLL